MSVIWFKREEKRKVTFRMGENMERKNCLCVAKKGVPTVYPKCEGNPWGVSTCIGGSRHR